MELALLPAIESAYKPNAISRSKAGGLWQFVPGTAREYGLHTDWWFDARRDALASTNAALDYLSRLNKMFDGDWHLTLAAYNAGPGTVRRAIRKNARSNKATDYQSLKLRTETRRYVPKLQAIKNIVLNPERFDVTLKPIKNQVYFSKIALSQQTDLDAFAQEAEINSNLLRHMNAGFLRWATPPRDGQYILVPSEKLQAANSALSLQSDSPIEFHQHEIKSGDTLGAIARQYQVSIQSLRQTNNLRGSSIRAGKTLIIPIADKQRQGAISAKQDINQPRPASVENGQQKKVHQVAKGDTLWSISKQYQVHIDQLLAWNKLSINQILSLGQTLHVGVTTP